MGLTELIDISRHYGRNPDYVLAGGGNTSFKDEELLYIKASGTMLAEITAEGLVRMRRDRLEEIWSKRYSADAAEREAQALRDLLESRIEGEVKRPSVETLLHALLRQPYVVHTHPTLVNGLTCGEEGEAVARELFDGDALWIPTTNPGYILALTIRSTIDGHLALGGSYPTTLILQNHGIFVAGVTPEEIKHRYTAIVSRLEERVTRRANLTEIDGGQGDGLSEAFAQAVDREGRYPEGQSCFLLNEEIRKRVADAESFLPLASFGYTPDHIVYCRVAPVWIPFRESVAAQAASAVEAVARYTAHFGHTPRVAAYERRGFAVYGENGAAFANARALLIDLIKLVAYAESFGGALLMPPEQIEFIRGWEVERYRASILGPKG